MSLEIQRHLDIELELPLGPRLGPAHPLPGAGASPCSFPVSFFLLLLDFSPHIAGMAVPPPLVEEMAHLFFRSRTRQTWLHILPHEPRILCYMDNMAPGTQSALHVAVTDKVSQQAAFCLPKGFILSPACGGLCKDRLLLQLPHPIVVSMITTQFLSTGEPFLGGQRRRKDVTVCRTPLPGRPRDPRASACDLSPEPSLSPSPAEWEQQCLPCRKVVGGMR